MKKRQRDKFIKYRIAAACVLVLQMMILFAAVMSTRPDLNWAGRNRHHRQYEELSIAMRNGHVWLEEVPPVSLQEMENPYDYTARTIRSAESGDDYLSDTSYYNGRYYVYFGVVPEIIFFLPLRLMTGRNLPTWAAVLLCSFLFMVETHVLLQTMCLFITGIRPDGSIRRPAGMEQPQRDGIIRESAGMERKSGCSRAGARAGQESCSIRRDAGTGQEESRKSGNAEESSFFLQYILLTFAFMGAGQAIYIAHYATVYTMPLITAMTCGVWGLSCWIMAQERMEECRIYTDSDAAAQEGRRYPYRHLLVLGSVLLAMVIGCRPQMALFVLLAFPIFAEELRHGAFFRRNRVSMTNTLCVLVPFFLIGGALMWYNRIRFDNPFEFGVKYLLTVTDMAHQTLDFSRLPVGLRLHLFAPMQLTNEFPFVKALDVTKELASGLYVEPLAGGFFACSPIAALGICCPLLLLLYRRRAGAPEKEERCAGASAKKYRLLSNLSFIRRSAGFGSVSLGCAVVITVLDIVMAGISQRYHADYAIFYMLAAAALILCLSKVWKNTPAGRAILILTAVLAAECVVMNILITLSEDLYFSVKSLNPEGYQFLINLFRS